MKERSLLLDMYKTCTKETRDKVALMAAEKKIRGDLEDCRSQIKKMSETNKEAVKKLADEDATRRIKQLEDQVEGLRKQVANNKQEEETLIIDMEVTGQALEDMQEQNSRLIQQLREKDDANFKLMSERIKSNQIARLAREEKEMYIQQVATLTTQVFTAICRMLLYASFPGRGAEPGGEEVGRERAPVANQPRHRGEGAFTKAAGQNSFLESKSAVQCHNCDDLQAMEMHKRKAIESAQSAADLKLHLEKYHGQIKEVSGSFLWQGVTE